jgi:hypothetical protein
MKEMGLQAYQKDLAPGNVFSQKCFLYNSRGTVRGGHDIEPEFFYLHRKGHEISQRAWFPVLVEKISPLAGFPILV